MSELVLKITADPTGLRQVKAATDELRSVLNSGLTISSQDIAKLTTELAALSTQTARTNQDLKSVAAGLTGVVTEARNAEQATNLTKASFSQLAVSTEGLSKALTVQKKETLSTLAAMADMDRYLKSQAQNTLALVGVKELLNKEFAKQISLRTIEAADKDGQLTKERQHTAALAEQLAVKNLISQADLRAIKTAATAGTPAVISLENRAVEARAAAALATETLSLEKGMEDLRTAAVKAGVEKRLALQKSYAKSVVALVEETASLEKGLEDMRTAAVAAGVEKRLTLQRSAATSNIALWRETASLEKGFEDMRTAAVAAGVEQRLALQRSAAVQAMTLAEETFALEKGLENMRTAAVAAGVEKRKIMLRAAAKDALLTAELAAVPTATVSPQSLAALRQTALSATNAAVAIGAMSKAEAEAAAVSMGLASALTTRLNPAMASATSHSTALRDATRGIAGASGGLWMAYGQLLPMMAGFATAAGMIKGVKLSAEFEHITKTTDTVAKANGDLSLSLDTLREKLLAIKNVEHSPAELGGAVKALVKAGFQENQAAAEIANMSKTATVAQEDLATVTKGVAAQYRAWNEEVTGTDRGLSSLKQTANIMAYVANATATDFGELNKALAYTPALAQLSKISFAEMTAAVGMLSNVGITGTMGATALQTSIVRLQNPTKELTKLLEHNNIVVKTANADGSLKTFTEQFEGLAKAIQPLGDSARSEILAEWFGLRGIKAGMPLVNEFSKAIGEGSLNYRKIVEAAIAAGKAMTYVDDASKSMLDNAKGQWNLFKTDLERTFTESFKDQGPVRGLTDALRQAVEDGSLRKLIDGLSTLATWLIKATAFAVEYKEEILSIGAALLAGKVITGVWSFVAALEGATAATKALNIVTSLNPWVLLATSVIGVITYLKLYSEETGQAKEATEKWRLKVEELRNTSSTVDEFNDKLKELRRTTNAPLDGDSWFAKLLAGVPKDEAAVDAAISKWSGRVWKNVKSFTGALAAELTGEVGVKGASKEGDTGGLGYKAQAFIGSNSFRPFEPLARAAEPAFVQQPKSAGVNFATGYKPDKSGAGAGLDDPDAEAKRLAKERKEDAAAKNAEWYAQRKLQKQDLEASLLAQGQQAAYNRELSLQDAYHKAGLSSTSEYVKKKEELWHEANAAQMKAAADSILNLEAQLGELEKASKGTHDDTKRREMDQKAAALSDNIQREKAALEELEKAKAHRTVLFSQEETTANKEYAKSLRSVTDAAKELVESSRIEAALATTNEGASKLKRDLVKIERDRQKGYRGLQDSGDFSDPEKLAQMKAAYDEQENAAREAYQAEQELRQDWKSGWKKGFADYAYAAEDTFGAAQRFAGNTFKTAEDALVSFVKTGKVNFRSLIDTMITDLIRFSSARAVAGLGASIIGMIGGSGFNAETSFEGAAADVSYTSSSVELVKAANGHAFENISGISNQVLTSPTFFNYSGITPFAKGGGVAGEAGPEAVMPLERDSRGRLGVIVSNPPAEKFHQASAGPAVINHNSVTVSVPVEQAKDQEAAQQFGKTVSKMIEEKMLAMIVKQQSPGGLLYARR